MLNLNFCMEALNISEQSHTQEKKMGKKCIPVADSFLYLAKIIKLCKV